MSSRGLIYLYDSDTNEPISIRKYADRQKRKVIIRDWRRRYAHAFYRCYIIISPEVSDDYDYDYMEKELDKSIEPVKKSNIERPRAEYKTTYNTSPLYNYDIP